MSNFFNDNIVDGKPINAYIGLICSILSILLSGAALIFPGTTFIFIVTAATWALGVFQSRKGKLSEKKKIAQIAQVLLVLAVICIIFSCAWTMGSTLVNVFVK